MQKIGAFDQPVAVAQSRCGDVDGIDGPETNGQQESVYADALGGQPASGPRKHGTCIIPVADSPELIGRQLGRRFVAIIHAPDVPITKIVEQFLVLLVSHIARPDDAGVIDVRLVVDPLAIHIVVGAVVRDDYEMSTRETLQLGANCWHVEIAARPARLYSHMRKHSGDSQQDHRQANQRNDSYQRLAEAIAVEPPQSQAAHALHEDEINDAGRRCNIIWECPKFY